MARTRKMSKNQSVAERLEEFGLDRILDGLIDGQSLREIARDAGVSAAGILRWIDGDEARRRQYALARVIQADVIASEIVAIADEPVPTDADGRLDATYIKQKRVRIDARKWVAAKFKPQTYGERLDVSANTVVELTSEQAIKRAQVLLEKLGLCPVASTDGRGVIGLNGSDVQAPTE